MFLNGTGKIVTTDSIFESLDNLFFENILNSLNKDVADAVKDKFHDAYLWYISYYELEKDRFGFEMLSYLIFLYQHNLLDRFDLKSLSGVAVVANGYKIPSAHFILVIPKEAHDLNIDYYYNQINHLVESCCDKNVTHSNPKLNSILNYHKNRKDPRYDDWVILMTSYLYQSQDFNEDEYGIIYEAINNNKEEYKDFLEFNGFKDKIPKEKLEVILEAFINMKLGRKKIIK